MTTIDRRNFIASSLAAAPVASWSISKNKAIEPVTPSQRFIPFDQHVDEVGEIQAILDHFPILTKHFCVLGNDEHFKQSRHERMAEYLTDYYRCQDFGTRLAAICVQPPSMLCKTSMLTIPTSGKPIRHWWLIASNSYQPDMRLSVVHITSEINLHGEFKKVAKEVCNRINKQYSSPQPISNYGWLIGSVNRCVLESLKTV